MSITQSSSCLSLGYSDKDLPWDNAQVILVGNKCDMEEERVVPTEKGRLLAEQLGMCMTYVGACVHWSGANGGNKCVFVFGTLRMCCDPNYVHMCSVCVVS